MVVQRILKQNVFGIGNDIVPIERFERMVTTPESQEILLQRLFGNAEIESLLNVSSKSKFFKSVAASFAVKEAVFKALGTGLAPGMSWRDIEVEDHWRSCKMSPSGRIKEVFHQSGISNWNVSCSASGEHAIAFAILFCE